MRGQCRGIALAVPGTGRLNRLDNSACAILLGGRSRRMGGGAKALLEVAGKSLLQHVIERVRPQVEELMLSVESASPAFEPYGLEQVPDPEPGSNGPLGGAAAALGRAKAVGRDWLLLVPCDAPFLPGDLAVRLHGRAVIDQVPLAVARDAFGLQPAFSLWNCSLLAELDLAVNSGAAGLKQFLRGVAHAEVEWTGGSASFFNINDRDALEQARSIAAGTTGSNQ